MAAEAHQMQMAEMRAKAQLNELITASKIRVAQVTAETKERAAQLAAEVKEEATEKETTEGGD